MAISTGSKLGILISTSPEAAGFRHGLRLAESALASGVDVYLYCIDEAVTGVGNADLQRLRQQGLKLYACAYGAQRRNLPLNDLAVFAGLTVVHDLMASTDRFVSFN
jgi:predicted peroxiredoxin